MRFYVTSEKKQKNLQKKDPITGGFTHKCPSIVVDGHELLGKVYTNVKTTLKVYFFQLLFR